MYPTSPRQKRIPIRIVYGPQNHHFSTPKEQFHKQYYEVHDQSHFKSFKRLLIESCSGTVIQSSQNLKKLYSEDVNFDKLKVKLQMLPYLVYTMIT